MGRGIGLGIKGFSQEKGRLARMLGIRKRGKTHIIKMSLFLIIS